MSPRPHPARRPNGSPRIPLHSVRVSDERWTALKEQASEDGVTISHAVNILYQKYIDGEVGLD